MTTSATTRRWQATFLAGMATVVAAVAAVGVFGRGELTTEVVESVRGETYELVTTGVYAWNPERLVAEGIGWDVVTLVLGVPALLLTVRGVARGSLRARLAAVGLLGYLFYQYLMYAMAWAVGPLLVPFIVIYAASLAGIAWLVSTIEVHDLPARVSEGFPRRTTAVVCGLMAVLLLGMWLPMIAQVIDGDLEDTLHGQMTLVVQALDLGIVVPLALTTAVLVWRRRPLGYLLATTVVVKGLAMGVAITAMVLSAWRVEGELAVGDLAIFVGFSAVFLALIVAMYRAIHDLPRPRAGADATELTPAR